MMDGRKRSKLRLAANLTLALALVLGLFPAPAFASEVQDKAVPFDGSWTYLAFASSCTTPLCTHSMAASAPDGRFSARVDAVSPDGFRRGAILELAFWKDIIVGPRVTSMAVNFTVHFEKTTVQSNNVGPFAGASVSFATYITADREACGDCSTSTTSVPIGFSAGGCCGLAKTTENRTFGPEWYGLRADLKNPNGGELPPGRARVQLMITLIAFASLGQSSASTSGFVADGNIVRRSNPVCTPGYASPAPGETVTLSAGGGDGSYVWSAPGGTPSSGTGPTFFTSYATYGGRPVQVTSEGGSAECYVWVFPASRPWHLVDLSPSLQSKTIPVKGVAAYEILVTNQGDELDTFRLDTSANAGGWKATLSHSSITLEPGASGKVLLHVKAPAKAGTFAVTVTGTSVSDPAAAMDSLAETTSTK